VWQDEVQRLGSPEVDDEFEFGGLAERQLCELCPFEDLLDLANRVAMDLSIVG
jgi:hypothetical protein